MDDKNTEIQLPLSNTSPSSTSSIHSIRETNLVYRFIVGSLLLLILIVLVGGYEMQHELTSINNQLTSNGKDLSLVKSQVTSANSQDVSIKSQITSIDNNVNKINNLLNSLVPNYSTSSTGTVSTKHSTATSAAPSSN